MLQALLDEGVSIRDLVRIFEALSLRAARHQGPRRARRGRPDRARPGDRRAVRWSDGTLPVITLDPLLEQRLLESLRPGEHGHRSRARPRDRPGAAHPGSRSSRREVENRNIRPVLVCAPQIRAALRRLVQPIVPRLAVLSYQELTGADQIRSEGVVATSRSR